MQNKILSYAIRDSLYLNIHDHCTLVCTFCPKTHGIRQVHDYDLTLDHRPSASEVIETIGDPARYHEIVFCGFGEPTLRLKPLLEIATWIKEHGGRVRLNTDGLANLVYKRNVLPEMQGLVDALSVSMNAQNEATYNRHCQPSLSGAYDAMLAFLEQAPRYIPSVTATAIDGLAGVSIDACAAIAARLGVQFRSRTLDAVG